MLALSSLEKIKSAISPRSREDYARLRDWFSENDWDERGGEVERDSAAGELDFLSKEAVAENNLGLLENL